MNGSGTTGRKVDKEEKERNEKGEANIQNRTATVGEETSEQPTSKYGDRNPSWSSQTGEKEEDTDAKIQKAIKTTPGVI